MRILHVVTAFPRTPDDVIVPWLVELLKRLRAAGHEVEVFTSSYRGAPGDDVLRRGVAVGEGRPALLQGLSRVGRATLGPRDRDLPVYGRRAAGARRRAHRSHPVHHVASRASGPPAGGPGRHRSGVVR